MTRRRRYLTESEMKRLLLAAGGRDRAMVLLAWRHGLRVSELVNLRVSDIDFDARLLHVSRLKNGTPSVHPLGDDEMDAIQSLNTVGFLFVSRLSGPMTANAFYRNFRKLGEKAGLPFAIHPHMLRHACGYALANAGHDTRAIQGYLGHRNIQHTVRYTELAPGRFKNFWRNAA